MNVLLVVLDSVRAANCSLYGARRETTPELQTLSEEATTYTAARAPSNWSVPSHVSLFTGLEPDAHQVTIHDRLAPGHTIWDDLGEAGFDTGLFTENGFVASHPVGLHESFDHVVSVPDDPPASSVTGETNDGPDGFYYAEALLDWTAQRDRWAACLNLMDAHRPYEPRPEYDRWGGPRAWQLQSALPVRWEFDFHGGERPYWQLGGLEGLYDGGIRQTDAILATVLGALSRRGVSDETLLVVCGDHGEGLGEHSRHPAEPRAVGHIVPMTESLLHVPLVVKHPGQQTERRVHDPAALTAFPAVVEAALDGDRETFARERVLAAKQPVTGDLRERYETAVDDPEPHFAFSRAVYERIDGDLVKTQAWGDSVVRMRVDPARSRSLERTGGREALATAFEKVEPAGVSLDRETETTAETRQRLEALGYF
jgi:arylsulfatase A